MGELVTWMDPGSGAARLPHCARPQDDAGGPTQVARFASEIGETRVGNAHCEHAQHVRTPRAHGVAGTPTQVARFAGEFLKLGEETTRPRTRIVPCA